MGSKQSHPARKEEVINSGTSENMSLRFTVTYVSSLVVSSVAFRMKKFLSAIISSPSLFSFDILICHIFHLCNNSSVATEMAEDKSVILPCPP